MFRRFAHTLAFACVVLTTFQIQTLLNKAQGESPLDPVSVACVAHNRLKSGMPFYRVNAEFHAKPQKINSTFAESAKNALLDGKGCNPKAFFQWSDDDVAMIQPAASSFLFSSGGNNFYDEFALVNR